MNLRGRVVVITGAASGLGRALSEAAASRGALLELVDVDAGELGAIPKRDGIETHVCDVSNPEAVAAVATTIGERHARVDVLINNAGIYAAGNVGRQDIAVFRRVMEVNFIGTVYACRAFLPLMRRAGSARIVNVLSDFALFGFPGKSAYCSSKFALRGFTEALRTELSGTDVGVTAIFPPAMDTNLVRKADGEPEALKREADFVQRNALPVGRVAHKIVRAIEKERGRVRIGWLTRVIDWSTRIAPLGSQKVVGRLKHRFDFVDSQGEGPTEAPHGRR